MSIHMRSGFLILLTIFTMIAIRPALCASLAEEYAEQALFYRITVSIWDKRWEDAEKLRNMFMVKYNQSPKINIVQDEYGLLITRRIIALEKNEVK